VALAGPCPHNSFKKLTRTHEKDANKTNLQYNSLSLRQESNVIKLIIVNNMHRNQHGERTQLISMHNVNGMCLAYIMRTY